MFARQHFADLICLVSITGIHVLLCRILRHCINSVLIVSLNLGYQLIYCMLFKMNEIAFNKTIIYYSILCLLDVGLVIANYVVQALGGYLPSHIPTL